MSETSGKEKEETFLAPEESSLNRARRWIEEGERWGVSRKDNDGSEQEKKEKRGGGKAQSRRKRGRPTKAEQLGRERRDSSVGSGSIANSWGSKRERESDSDTGEEGKEQKQQGVKRIKEGGAAKMEEQQDENKIGNVGEMERMIRKLLKEQRDDIVRDIKRELREEIKEEVRRKVKREMENFKSEEGEKRKKLKKENAEMWKRMQELEKGRKQQERRERRFNVVIRGAEVEGRNVRDVALGVLNKMGELDKHIKIREAYKIGNRGKESAIIVKLKNLDDKKAIMGKKNNLRGMRVYVDDDLSRSERERQSEVRMWAKREREKGENVKVGLGKAWKNGKEFVWNEERKSMNEKGFR